MDALSAWLKVDFRVDLVINTYNKKIGTTDNKHLKLEPFEFSCRFRVV